MAYFNEKKNAHFGSGAQKRARWSGFFEKLLRPMVGTLLAAAIITSTACNMRFRFTAEPRESALYEEVSDAVGLNIPYGNMKLKYESHGGFHGDGVTFAAARLTAESESVIIASPEWRSFPFPETVEKLIYGKDSSGPYVTDEDGNALFPRIENGYYILIDRFDGDDGNGKDGQNGAHKHEKADAADPFAYILERGSLNFTIAVYDPDACTLYFAKMDT